MGVLRPSRRSSAAIWSPVFFGQHDVEHEQVVLVHVRQHRGLISVGRHIHGVALLPEPLLDETGDFAIVFYDKDFHGIWGVSVVSD